MKGSIGSWFLSLQNLLWQLIRLVWCFLQILEQTWIIAFDLSEVTETFVRHKETLQRELKRHLNPLEGRIFDSMAWEKGSLMKNSLIAANPGISTEINCPSLLAQSFRSTSRSKPLTWCYCDALWYHFCNPLKNWGFIRIKVLWVLAFLKAQGITVVMFRNRDGAFSNLFVT